MPTFPDAFEAVQDWLQSKGLPRTGQPLLLGICGAQGSGKTTLAAKLADHLMTRGVRTASFSLDDLYNSRAVRQQMARDIHPLFATRGVPGTHDVTLGHKLLDEFKAGRALRLPRFDKARDDRLPSEQWPETPANMEVLIFEGWCVGARAQLPDALIAPVNALERDEDIDGVWRQFSNDRLATEYRILFDRLDYLILLAAPAFECVAAWRSQQEAELKRNSPPDAPGVMDASALTRFISHYERLTRHILAEMPDRADFTIALTDTRRVSAVTTSPGHLPRASKE